jgi:hypothetical protein
MILYVIGAVSLFLILERRGLIDFYKDLDSEIKQLIFEEQTGYQPLKKKGKFTFKYKAWLYLNSKQQIIL